MSDAMERIRRVKRAHEPHWMGLEGVVAVGIGRTAGGRDGIIVSVRADAARLRREIPPEVEGVPVEIRVGGELRAQ